MYYLIINGNTHGSRKATIIFKIRYTAAASDHIFCNAVYFQGGLTWQHAKFGILMSLQKLVDAGMVTL